MDFGDAIRALKDGKRVSRAGWSGKNMFLLLTPGAPGVPIPAADWPGYPLRPFITMKDAQDMLVPWLASQTDMLSEDWGVVDPDTKS